MEVEKWKEKQIEELFQGMMRTFITGMRNIETRKAKSLPFGTEINSTNMAMTILINLLGWMFNVGPCNSLSRKEFEDLVGASIKEVLDNFERKKTVLQSIKDSSEEVVNHEPKS